MMRTTLVLDEDVYEVASQRARINRTSLGKAVSEMARASLKSACLEADERGFPVLVSPGAPGSISHEAVRKLAQDDEDDEAVRATRR